LFRKTKRSDHLGDIAVDGRRKEEYISEKWKCGLDSSDSGWSPLAGFPVSSTDRYLK
jgi:hypothetical protein